MVGGNAAALAVGMHVGAVVGMAAPTTMLPDAIGATPLVHNNILGAHLTNNEYATTDGAPATATAMLNPMIGGVLPLPPPIFNSATSSGYATPPSTQQQLQTPHAPLSAGGALLPHATPSILPIVSSAAGGASAVPVNYMALTASQQQHLAQLQINSNGGVQLPPPSSPYNAATQSPLPPHALLPPTSALSTSPQPTTTLPLIMPPTGMGQQQQQQQPQLSPLLQSSILSPQHHSSNHAPTASNMHSPRASTPTQHSPQTVGHHSQSQSPAAHQFGGLSPMTSSPMSQCGTPQPPPPPPLNVHAVQEAKEKLKQEKKEKHATKKLMKELAICKTLLGEMELHEDSWPFLLPVNTKQFPTYRKIIKNPMDLSTIKKRLQDLTYKSREDFCVDVRQIFDNCEMFNEDDSPVGKAGHGMRKFFELRWAELTDKHS
uniref:Bromodomain adjacent to zinc finger domain protein 2B n=2 Tax=Bactrocera latifrons TaxID=174628 RepID=A0A0K8W8G6_BACLA